MNGTALAQNNPHFCTRNASLYGITLARRLDVAEHVGSARCRYRVVGAGHADDSRLIRRKEHDLTLRRSELDAHQVGGGDVAVGGRQPHLLARDGASSDDGEPLLRGPSHRSVQLESRRGSGQAGSGYAGIRG